MKIKASPVLSLAQVLALLTGAAADHGIQGRFRRKGCRFSKRREGGAITFKYVDIEASVAVSLDVSLRRAIRSRGCV